MNNPSPLFTMSYTDAFRADLDLLEKYYGGKTKAAIVRDAVAYEAAMRRRDIAIAQSFEPSQADSSQEGGA